MRILILGGDGMLGHQLFKSWRDRHEVWVTLRQESRAYKKLNYFDEDNASFGIDLRSVEPLIGILERVRPEAIVNCVGIVKQRGQSSSRIISLEINALLPHRLALLAREAGIRLVHMSTDCVFSGQSGNYLETDFADATDIYGKTKFLGEVSDKPGLTIRTSMIGTELSRKTGLLEWLLSNRGGTVSGFRQAIFSGFTTLETSRIIEKLLIDHPCACGLYHVSSAPISKFDLLTKINRALKLNIKIVPDDEFRCNRSLDSTRFRTAFGYNPPSWDEMIAELA